MARIRSIKPEMRTSITVSMWPREVRYFFILLWGYFDDYGRGVDDELLIASDCFPRDRDITPEIVDGWLEDIAESGPLCRYEVDGRRYLHAPNWREHQKPSHPTRSKIPPCPDDEPDDFKRWREINPQRLTNRSRKSRESLAKIPAGGPEASGRPSGRASEGASAGPGHVTLIHHVDDPVSDAEPDDVAGQDHWEDAPESLANDSGDAPDYFVPEQGSKGAREQGSKGARGSGGEGRQQESSGAVAEAHRPDGLHLIPDDFYLNDTMRRWVVATYPGLNPEFETEQFISYWRAEGRKKRNWHDAWQKWIRDSGKRAYERQQRGAPSNVVQLSSGQPLTGTDATVAGWAALAASLKSEDSA
jgi:hypothetical protein